MEISFPIEEQTSHWRFKPGSYLANIIGHEGPGSLHSYLKERGWITTLSTGVQDLARGFATFKITLHLSQNGFRESTPSSHLSSLLTGFPKKIIDKLEWQRSITSQCYDRPTLAQLTRWRCLHFRTSVSDFQRNDVRTIMRSGWLTSSRGQYPGSLSSRHLRLFLNGTTMAPHRQQHSKHSKDYPPRTAVQFSWQGKEHFRSYWGPNSGRRSHGTGHNIESSD
jgi:hypothetical protein